MFILRFIFSIIVVLIYFILLLIIPKNICFFFSKKMATVLIKTVNFKSLNIINKYKFDNNLHSNQKFLIVSNHCSLWDGIVLTASLQDISFLISKAGLNTSFCSKFVMGKLDCLIVHNNNTVKKIKEKVENRKKSENVLVVFPDGMQPIPPEKVISPFKTGAFFNKFPVLPVVIKYKNFKINPTSFSKDHALYCWTKVILDGNCDINVEILDLIYPDNNESISDYRDKVYNIMTNCYNKL